MELTKDLLTAKRAELKAAYEKATAEMNAFGGALQFCDFLLSELDKQPPLAPAIEKESA